MNRSDVDMMLGIAPCQDCEDGVFPAMGHIWDQFAKRPGPLMSTPIPSYLFSPGEPVARPKTTRERILDLLADGTNRWVSDIARALDISPDVASKAITNMTVDGWVKKDKRLGSGRAVFVSLTQKGRAEWSHRNRMAGIDHEGRIAA